MLNIADDGTLTPVPGSPFSTTHAFAFAYTLDFSCDGNTLFVGNATTSPPLIDVFSVGNSGALTPLPGSPFSPGVAADSGVIQLGPNNQYLFVTNLESATVTVFHVRPDRSLEPVSGSPFPAGGLAPAGITINQSGTVLVVVMNGSPTLGAGVGAFKIAPDGSLTAVTGSPFKLRLPAFDTRLSTIASYPVRDCTLRVDGVSVSGKKLFVAGQNFDNGSLILLNGEPQKTKNDGENWTTTLIGKKSGKNVRIGDKIQVLTANGRLSPVFIVTSLNP
jgi:6-phosphogluconolactonase (cycloisomerase 2 family)